MLLAHANGQLMTSMASVSTRKKVRGTPRNSFHGVYMQTELAVGHAKAQGLTSSGPYVSLCRFLFTSNPSSLERKAIALPFPESPREKTLTIPAAPDGSVVETRIPQGELGRVCTYHEYSGILPRYFPLPVFGVGQDISGTVSICSPKNR